MPDFPIAALPETAQPWGRAVEAHIQQLESENRTLRSANEQLTEMAAVRDQRLDTQQLQIRAICALAGFAYPPVEVGVITEDAPPATPVAAKVTTKEFPAVWSATWYQSFKRTSPGGQYDDRDSLYQRGSGYTYSQWRFDIGPAAGKQITKVEMYLSNVDSYYNGDFTVFLGTHGNRNEPASRPSGGRVNAWDVGWRTGEGKWIPINKKLYAAISNGSVQGFTMGDYVSDRQNFARFNGEGRSGAPKLRVTYNV